MRISLGKIVAAHGIKGLVKILPFGGDPKLLKELSPIYKGQENGATIEITLKNAIGKYWLAEIEGVKDRNAAESIIGTELWVEESLLPAPKTTDNKLYAHHLIGLAVIDNGASTGTIKSVVNYGAGDLLEIQTPEGLSFLMPFTHENFGDIDNAAKTIEGHNTAIFIELAS